MITKRVLYITCILVVFCANVIFAADFQLVSTIGSVPSTSANGDSGNPIVSADGRFVLFSSSANNLVSTNAAGPVPSLKPSWQNVYLRDRLSGSNFLISVSPLGDGGDHNSWPIGISTNDQFVLFESSADNLVLGDTNQAPDVFVRDVVNGTTTLVSVNTNEIGGNGGSYDSAMTPDGRFVVFVSAATDLVPKDTNGIADIFVRDLLAGTTTLVSQGAISAGTYNSSSASESPVITPDGRYVAFYSTATNLTVNTTIPGEIYLRDLIATKTTWISSNALNSYISNYNVQAIISCCPNISDDGRWIGYLVCSNGPSYNGFIVRYDTLAGANNVICTNAFVPTYLLPDQINTLAMSSDGRFLTYIANYSAFIGTTSIYQYDALIGTNVLVSLDPNTGLAVKETCDALAMDPTGRYVLFTCNPGTNLVATPLLAGIAPHLFLRDMQLGQTQLIDVDTNGFGEGIGSLNFSISADASLVAFEAATDGFTPNDRNHDYDVIAYNTSTETQELISAGITSLPSLAPNGYSKFYSTSLSTNARFIAFTSSSDNVVTNDFNLQSDVFVRDTLLGINTLISVGNDGNAAAGASGEPSISGDGRFVAYSSFATNIVFGVTDKAENIFLYDSLAGTNMLVYASPTGSSGNTNSYSPQISSAGRYVLFRCQAFNLSPGPPQTGPESLYLRDLSLNTNYTLASGSVVNTAMTPDGHYVAYVGVTAGNSSTNLYVWDSSVAGLIYTNASVSLNNVAISADGNWIAYVSGTVLYAFDRADNTNYTVATALFDQKAGLQFSADDHFLVFSTKTSLTSTDTNGTYDVYLYDFQRGTNLLVSQSYNTFNAANQASCFPSLSPDGRFVAYRSFASNLVPNDTNNFSKIYLYDRISGMTRLITVDQTGDASVNFFSQSPLISADGKNLVFASYASDLSGYGFGEYNSIYDLNISSAATGTNINNLPTPVMAAINVSGLSSQTSSAPSPVITWQATSGIYYQIQYKDNLSDPVWLDLNGSVTEVGPHGQAKDLSPAPDQRFYRIITTN